MTSSDSPPDSLVGRRAAFAVLGNAVLALVLTACAADGGEPTYRGGRRRHRDGRPFWQREEQRND